MDKRGNLVIVVVGLLSICCLVDSVPDTTMISHTCSNENAVDENYFDLCLKRLFAVLPEATANHGYNWYVASSPGTLPCFGHGACYGGLSRDECISCLRTAEDYVVQENCEWNIGVQFQLVDCRLRYEKYEFKED